MPVTVISSSPSPWTTKEWRVPSAARTPPMIGTHRGS